MYYYIYDKKKGKLFEMNGLKSWHSDTLPSIHYIITEMLAMLQRRITIISPQSNIFSYQKQFFAKQSLQVLT